MPAPIRTRPKVEQTTQQLCQRIIEVVGKAMDLRRVIVAIAGPPAAGKSTLLTILINNLQNEFGAERVVGVPMDGFHLDNYQLNKFNLLSRKGAPHTFDIGGLVSLVKRLSTSESPVYAPEFDRASDLSRNCAIKIENTHDVVLIEGNYLLLDQPGWRELNDYFDLSISIDVPDATLQKRLVQRWLDNGLSAQAALTRAKSNDIPNAVTVREQSRGADIIYRPES